MRLSAFVVALVCGGAVAQPHQHGVVEMNLVKEGNQLLIELHSPAANLVGFEHKAKSQQQQRQIEQASQLIKQAAKRFILPSAANCQFDKVDIVGLAELKMPLAEQHDKHDQGQHDHDKHDHDKHDHDKHDHDQHDHAKHGHDKHDHAKHGHDKHDYDQHDHGKHDHDQHDHESKHKDIQLSYWYQCKNIQQLNQVNTAWFSAFPAIERIKVVALSEDSQFATDLSQDELIVFQ